MGKMENFLDKTIKLTINNYRAAKFELRNDGDLINHLASLIFTHKNTDIPFDKVKLIRKYIKANTSRISPFRGEFLYILSLSVGFSCRAAKLSIASSNPLGKLLTLTTLSPCGNEIDGSGPSGE